MISKEEEEEEERDGEEEESETGFEPSEINIRAQAEHTQTDDFQLPHEKKRAAREWSWTRAAAWYWNQIICLIIFSPSRCN